MRNLGREGERLAVFYLKGKGWNILDKNIRERFGEVDILGRDPEGILVFVEVKTLLAGIDLAPEDNLTFAKHDKMARMALAFANAHPEMVREKGWRIDVLAISILDCQSSRSQFTVCHYENV